MIAKITMFDDAFDVIVCESEKQWLAERNKGIGASEVAVLLGLVEWNSPFRLCGQKRGEIEHDGSDSEILEWGRYLEDPIARRYADRTGRELKDLGRWTILRSRQWPWLFATLDRVIVSVPTEGPGAQLYPVTPTMVGPAPLEIKAPTIYGYHSWDEGAPLHYQAQLQAQLAVTGWKWGSLNAGMPTGKFHAPIDCERNDDFIELIVEKSRAFMDCVESGAWPPVDASSWTTQALRSLYPRDNGSAVALGDEATGWLAEWEQAKAEKKLAEEHEALMKNQIVAAMGDATIGELPDGSRFTLKTQERGEHTVKATAFRVLRHQKASR